MDKQITELSTIKQMLLDKRRRGLLTGFAGQNTIPKRPLNSSIPVSFAQQRLWFLDQLEPDSPVYNITMAFRLQGELDIIALERSLNKIVHRHEALRTTLITVDGQPLQKIAPEIRLCLQTVSLEHRPLPEREDEARRLATDASQRPFNLAKGPLLRTQLLRLDSTTHWFLVITHHTVFDGWSTGLFRQELAELYRAFVLDEPASLPKLPIQYADFAHWQREWLQGKVLETQLSYWKQQLGGNLAPLRLPADHPRPTTQTFNGARQSLNLPQSLIEALKHLSQREEVTLFMTLFAAFNTLLYRYTGQEDILVGTPIANRTRSETESLIGFFANTLVLRADLSGNPSFRTLLGRVREVALQAYAHQDLPFEKLVEELKPVRDLSQSPLFQVMFILQNAPIPSIELPGLTLSRQRIDPGVARLDLTLSLEAATPGETEAGLLVQAEYNSDLFEPLTISRMLGHYRQILETIAHNPDQTVAALDILTAAERRQLLVDWNKTQSEYPREAGIHQLFERQTNLTPTAVAVSLGKTHMTYWELNRRANQLAHSLMARGIGPQTRVGICLERSPQMVVGLLAILKTGAAYVPMDPAYPKERLAFMLQDAQISLLITQQAFLKQLPVRNLPVINLDTDWSIVAKASPEDPNIPIAADQPAYLIYTSGSTGTPKGVVGMHQGAVNRFAWMWRTYPFEATEICCQKTSLSFVDSVWEIFGPLLQGIQTVIIPDPVVKDMARLVKTLAAEQVSRIVLVPSLLQTMLETQANLRQQLPRLRIWICSGETLSPELCHQFHEQMPRRTLLNLYGSSEASADSTYYETGHTPAESTIPIGRPIANTQLYILDQHLQPVPIGVPGELYIGGDGLAQGYFNQAALTAEKFIQNPFATAPGPRLYKTGDRGRYLPDGNLEYLGRLDHQVKLRGFRIELGEIETVLRQHPDVQQAVVIVRDADAQTLGQRHLVAYVVLAREATSKVGDLRTFLKQKLPDYMIPFVFIRLDRLPLTPNGKLDRQALPAPDKSQIEIHAVFLAPRDEFDRKLLRIWEQLLAVRPIGITDNFFEIGGHSLLAVHLFDQIEKTFGEELPLSVLFKAPTIWGLANLLREASHREIEAPVWSSIVAIQSGGNKPPLFLAHAGGGHVLFYRDLARHLGPDQPVYGMQAHGIYRQEAPLARIEDMAAHFILGLRAIQPEGPYFLAGSSFGGLIALEVAQQLRDQNQQVAFLAMFDTYGPGYPRYKTGISPVRRQAYQLFHRLNHHLGSLKHLPPQKRTVYVRQKAYKAGNQIKKQITRLFKRSTQNSRVPRTSDLPASLQKTQNVIRWAAQNYEPKSYPEPVVLFRASDQPLGIHPDPSLGWETLISGGLEIHEVPGHHGALVAEPRVGYLVEKFKPCLVRAQSASQGISANNQ